MKKLLLVMVLLASKAIVAAPPCGMPNGELPPCGKTTPSTQASLPPCSKSVLPPCSKSELPPCGKSVLPPCSRAMTLPPWS